MKVLLHPPYNADISSYNCYEEFIEVGLSFRSNNKRCFLIIKLILEVIPKKIILNVKNVD